jgi:hypothetical protein
VNNLKRSTFFILSLLAWCRIFTVLSVAQGAAARVLLWAGGMVKVSTEILPIVAALTVSISFLCARTRVRQRRSGVCNCWPAAFLCVVSISIVHNIFVGFVGFSARFITPLRILIFTPPVRTT